MKLVLAPAGDSGLLTLDRQVTLERAVELKAILLKALKHVNRLTINLTEVAAADLSFLQLICSAYTSFNKLDKELALSGKDSAVIKQLLKDTGFSRHDVCALNINQQCIWSGGDNQ